MDRERAEAELKDAVQSRSAAGNRTVRRHGEHGRIRRNEAQARDEEEERDHDPRESSLASRATPAMVAPGITTRRTAAGVERCAKRPLICEAAINPSALVPKNSP